MPIESITGSDVPGVNVYYVKPPTDVVNVFTAFWSNFLQTRTLWARDLYQRRLAASDPQQLADNLLRLDQLRQDALEESGRTLRSNLDLARSQGRDATLIQQALIQAAAGQAFLIVGHATGGAVE